MLRAAQNSRPKIGLALSGGGARGAAHIGVFHDLPARKERSFRRMFVFL